MWIVLHTNDEWVEFQATNALWAIEAPAVFPVLARVVLTTCVFVTPSDAFRLMTERRSMERTKHQKRGRF